MKRLLYISSLSLLFTFFFWAASSTVKARPEALPQQVQAEKTDEILVKFRDGTSPTERENLHRSLGAKVRGKVEKLDVEVIDVPKDEVDAFVGKYQKNERVEYAEPNYIATALEETNDPYLIPNQWGMYKVQAAGTGTSAWTTAKSDLGVKIAILDTGIDQNHEDLATKIAGQKNCTSSPTLNDLYGHGTHVAGIAAAATNNGIGVAGLGYNTTLMNYKSLGDNGSGYYSWIATCIMAAADDGSKVINMSLGAPYNSYTLESAVNYAWNKGVVLVAAAGNSGNASPTYPAYYKNVIAVAATDNNDVKASWSSYGKWVDVAAPGVNIYSTTPNHSNYLNTTYPSTFTLNYGYGSGTSMATPHVAGLAALVWPTPFGGGNANVRKQIETTADKIPGTGNYWAFGRINALNAVTILGAYPVKTKGVH